MDPFSAATGVAGLISLGFPLGKGLKTYCEDFESMDDDIALLSKHAERLATFVEMLDTRLEGQDPALSRSLKECYDACNICLQDFGALTQSTLEVQEPSSKKKRFEDLEAKMETFRYQLLARLQLLNYDGNIELRNSITVENARLLSAIEPLPQIKQAIDQLPEILVSQIIHALKSDLNLASIIATWELFLRDFAS
ncbi:Ankyrin repeat protein [Colletotrichum asianum]